VEFLQRHHVPVEVVPGVSSAIAGPAAAGVPVTHRSVSRSFAVVAGHTVDGLDAPNWKALAQIDTVVVLMGVAAVEEIAARLIAAGRAPETPAAAVQSATLPDQRQVIATLATLAQAMREVEIVAPAVLVIGEVVRLAQTAQPAFAWLTPMFAGEALALRKESASM
jgi:siroheme synthase